MIHFSADLAPMVQFTGDCNQCGICCVTHIDGHRYFCEHLEVKNLGEPGGTRCKVYDKRYDRMPITLMREDMGACEWSFCFKGSLEETKIILKYGIGQGCSYQVEMKEG